MMDDVHSFMHKSNHGDSFTPVEGNENSNEQYKKTIAQPEMLMNRKGRRKQESLKKKAFKKMRKIGKV